MRNKYRDFSIICNYLSISPTHKKTPIGDLHNFVFPLVRLGQYKIFDSGFVTWTWFSDEVEKKYIKHSRSIKPEDHNTGDNFWYMDIVCLGGPKKLREIRDDNLKNFGHLKRKYIRGFRKNNYKYVVEQPARC